MSLLLLFSFSPLLPTALTWTHFEHRRLLSSCEKLAMTFKMTWERDSSKCASEVVFHLVRMFFIKSVNYTISLVK